MSSSLAQQRACEIPNFCRTFDSLVQHHIGILQASRNGELSDTEGEDERKRTVEPNCSEETIWVSGRRLD